MFVFFIFKIITCKVLVRIRNNDYQLPRILPAFSSKSTDYCHFADLPLTMQESRRGSKAWGELVLFMSRLGWRGVKYAFEKLITGIWGGETAPLHLAFTKKKWIIKNFKDSQPWSGWILGRIWELTAHRSQRECDSLKTCENKWGQKRKSLGPRLNGLSLWQGPLGYSWPHSHH